MPNGDEEKRGHPLTVVIGSGIGAAILASGVTFLANQLTVPTQLTDLSAQMADLKTRAATLETRITQDRSELVSLQMKLQEVETQFRAEDVANNLEHAHDSQLIAVLWGKVFGSVLPLAGTYYPAIGQGQQLEGEEK